MGYEILNIEELSNNAMEGDEHEDIREHGDSEEIYKIK